MLRNTQSNISNLFRTVKPEADANSPSKSSVSVENIRDQAQDRWPLLKALPPTKWPTPPVLNNSEKQNRKLEPELQEQTTLTVSKRQPQNLVPSFETRISEGLEQLIKKAKSNQIDLQTEQVVPIVKPDIPKAHFEFQTKVKAAHVREPAAETNHEPNHETNHERALEPAFEKKQSLFSFSTQRNEPPAVVATVHTKSTSLRNLVNRIEAQSIAVDKPKPPGYFTRLGKR